MYSISEEDSFLPFTFNGNHTQQLAQVRGYYERQKTLTSYFNRDIESTRMAYCSRLCKEKERLGKSLWELENKKRRLLHQLTQPTSDAKRNWRVKSISEGQKAGRSRNKEPQAKSNRKAGRKARQQLKFERLEPINTAESQAGRHRTKSKGALYDDTSKSKVELEIPLFLLR